MPRTVMAVVAHPDDAELTCGGTLVRCSNEGAHTVLVVATDGGRGGKHTAKDQDHVVAQRRAEQEAAADKLGIPEVVFLGFSDGELQDNDTLRGSLVEQIRRVRPELVMLMDPLTVVARNSYINHRDHRVLGMACLDALYPQASNPFYFPDQLERGLAPHKVPELWLAASEQANHWVDVSLTLDRRFEALRCHRSQVQLWPEGGEGVIRQQYHFAAVAGVQHGVRYAEEFRRIVVDPLS